MNKSFYIAKSDGETLSEAIEAECGTGYKTIKEALKNINRPFTAEVYKIMIIKVKNPLIKNLK